MPSRLWLLVIACALLLAACGGDDSPSAKVRTQPPASSREREQPAAPLPGTGRNSLALPPGVPVRGSGPADPASLRVVRRWSDALRSGDVDRASGLWAIPSRVQNSTPVLLLRNRRTVRLFNSSLSCGSVVTGARRAGAFTITEFRLTERPGGQCGGAAGASARTAIKVRGGRIVEWYRLPDAPSGGGGGGTDPSALAPARPI